MDDGLTVKHEALVHAIRKHGRMAVAYSGGVDSSLLLKTAHDVLGNDVVAITASSMSMPSREMDAMREFCAHEGVRHVVVETHEFEIEGFNRNPRNRCYLCKREILSCIRIKAEELGFDTIAEGSNVDDDGDYRPGFQAVVEAGVVSPLLEAGLVKSDIRALARDAGLAMWDKPALACLNTRFSYGDMLTAERLAMVDKAECYLADKGFRQVRVRMRDAEARIEVPPDDLPRLIEERTRSDIVTYLHSLGFTFISADLMGYRTGSMNETM